MKIFFFLKDGSIKDTSKIKQPYVASLVEDPE